MADYFDKRQFYSCNKDYNFVSYVKSGSENKIDFVDYSGNNEKSHGVFNETGLLSDEKIKELKMKLQQTQSPIWHGLVSFKENFGNRYCGNYEKAFKLMKAELPKFFENAGLDKDNIEWFAGLHENTDNKHIHFSFYEKLPTRKKQQYGDKLFYSEGFIPEKAINRAKLNIEKKLLNISADIVSQRKEIITINKLLIGKGVTMKKIKQLLLIIPTSGRLSYDSENIAPFKSRIDSITNTVISGDKKLLQKFRDFEFLLRQNDEEMVKICERMKIKPDDKLLYSKYMQDIYRRLGNQVLYTIKEIRFEQSKYEYATKSRLALKRIEKRKKLILIKKCEYLNNLVNREAINCFQEFLHKLDEANYKRLVEEGIID